MSELTFMAPAIPCCDNPELKKSVQVHIDDLIKPKGSLGRLEELALQYILCRGSRNSGINKACLYTFAGDHGITRQKITPYPPEVTAQMVLNMLSGGAAVSVMCRNAAIAYSVVDAGVASDLPDHPLLLKRKIAPGTDDFSVGPAMTTDQCRNALDAGVGIAASTDADIIGSGEMGIANSASAAALYALFLDLDGKETTGAGTGASGALLERKKEVVSGAVEFHRREWDATPFDAVRRCGGFEIAQLCGLMLGAASRRVPVVVDGFICSAAALAAMRMEPGVADYLFFSHVSEEHFHRSFFEKENIRPILDLGMRLGEGTGAVLAIQIIRQALNCYHEMATFGSASVSRESRE